MKIGILGAGGIAGTLAGTMVKMKEVTCYAVASRSLDKAKEFAARFGIPKAYGSYAEMLQDPAVDLVYVATPHSHHYEHMKLCIQHGKNILCEKAFTMNAHQAREIGALAKEKGVYVAEAIWTRYMPSRKMIDEMLSSGVIGKVHGLTANLSYVISQNARIVRPELAGGALLDVGVYGLNFALMHFGTDIERIDSSVQMTDTGVDAMENVTIHYKDGKMAMFNAGIYARSDRKGIFYGDKGYMIVENINNPQSIAVYDTGDNLIQKVEVPKQITGYEYELLECREVIAAGGKESRSMPMSDTIYVMEIMDSIRKQWGLIYPQER